MARAEGPGNLDAVLCPLTIGLEPKPAPIPAPDPAETVHTRPGVWGVFESEVGVTFPRPSAPGKISRTSYRMISLTYALCRYEKSCRLPRGGVSQGTVLYTEPRA